MTILKAGSVVVVNGEALTLASDVEASPAAPARLYPALMWSKDGTEVTVGSEAEEAAKTAEGYRLTREADPALAPAVAEPVPPAVSADLAEPAAAEFAPTFGAPDDDTYAEGTTRKTANKKK